jgi:hypothetical protein
MKKLLTIALVVTGAAISQAEDSAFQLSLTPDIALKSKDTTIRGVSLGIWSENPQHSLTLGIVNGSTGNSSGFTWAFGVNYADNYTGVAWAFVNVSKESFVGWQHGAVNYSQGTFKGLQSGFINVAQDTTGVQLGALNYTENLNGIQVGFLNIVKNNGWFDAFPDKLATAFPIVNWSF